jgi:hypothetical protein
MSEADWQSIYRRDAEYLGQIGALLAGSEMPRIKVRLPKALASVAVEAWESEGDEAGPGTESFEQRAERRRAGTLALIGLSIQRTGRVEGDEVVVELEPHLIGLAIDAADSFQLQAT